MKLLYTQYADTDEPIMLINKHIGMDEEDGEGIMGDKFQAELMYLDSLGKKRIKVFVCSPGGDVMEGMKIYDAILSSKTKVDTYNGGVAASISGVICQAGRTRYMSDYSLLMMHNPFSKGDKSADTELLAFKNSLVKMLSRRNITSSETDISDFMNNTTWMSAEEAVKNGFCDVIVNSKDVNKPRVSNTEDINPKAAWKKYANYFNSINTPKPTQKEPVMKKVFNKLKINENSTEEVVLNAIEAIENKVTISNEAKEKAEGELATAKQDLVTAQNRVKDLEKAADEAKTAKDAEVATALENSAELLVNDAAKVGKIKNDADTIKSVKAQAIKDFEGTKAMLDAMPVTKKGPSIVNKLEDKVVKHTMGSAMIEIANRTAKIK